MTRELCRRSVRTWVARGKHLAGMTEQQRARFQRPLGVDEVIFADFQTRPKAPAQSNRPYVFGMPEARAQYTHGVVAIMQAHAELSERYRAGERALQFPAGTYPPPILLAA